MTKRFAEKDVRFKKEGTLCFDKQGNPVTGVVVWNENEMGHTETSYRDGKKHGLEKEYYADGTLFKELEYVDGVQTGVERYYYENGALMSEQHTVNGMQEGLAKGYYPDGALHSEDFYKNGQPHGLHKAYYRTGELRQETCYGDDGPTEYQKIYYKNGQLYRFTPYSEKGLDGLRKTYYQDGSLWSEVPWSDHQQQGEARWYRPDGSLMATLGFKNGSPRGNGKRYNARGEVEFELPYRDSARQVVKTFGACTMSYPVSSLTGEVMHMPRITCPSSGGLPEPSRLEIFLSREIGIGDVALIPHITLTKWQREKCIECSFDDEEPQEILSTFRRNDFYEINYAQNYITITRAIATNTHEKNVKNSAGFYILEFYEDSKKFSDHERFTIHAGKKGCIEFDISAIRDCLAFQFDEIEYMMG